jgi:hypothetical protein
MHYILIDSCTHFNVDSYSGLFAFRQNPSLAAAPASIIQVGGQKRVDSQRYVGYINGMHLRYISFISIVRTRNSGVSIAARCNCTL